MNSVSFKSPQDGAELTFTVRQRRGSEVDFEVSVRTPYFSGRAPASSFMNGPPTPLFEGMATHWIGWEGQKTWSDLEDRVTFTAVSDRTGHVSLRIELAGPDYHSALQVVLVFEAGQLEVMAAAVKELLG